MPASPEPPFNAQPQGISLDELAEAFAQVMGGEPRPSAPAGKPSDVAVPAGPPTGDAPERFISDPLAPVEEAEDHCPISPRSIFESMLFVGNRDNRPLTPARAAELMRDVSADDIPPLVDELNDGYQARGAPYRILGEGDGYRLALCPEFHQLRDRFYGRIREARLSQASVDVLALVAYQQPITGEKVGHLRGKPSSHILAHLVRRGLLRIARSEQSEPKRRIAFYHTTDRFLTLFNLETLDDLPRSEESGPP